MARKVSRRDLLEREYRSLAKEFNERAKEIKKAGKASKTVDYIKSTISSGAIGKRGNLLHRLKSRKISNYEEAIQLLKKVRNWKSSTLEGVTEIENQRIETMKENYPELDRMSDDEINEILTFLGSVKGVESKNKYDSDQLILALGMQKIDSRTKSIKDIYDEMQESDKTLADYIRNSLEKNKDKDWISF